MDFVLEFAKNYFMEMVVTGFFGCIVVIAKKALDIFKTRVNNEIKEQALIKQGVLSLLKFRINRLCAVIEENEQITIDCKMDLDDMFKSYEALGGNGRTKIRYLECIKNYPIKG